MVVRLNFTGWMLPNSSQLQRDILTPGSRLLPLKTTEKCVAEKMHDMRRWFEDMEKGDNVIVSLLC